MALGLTLAALTVLGCGTSNAVLFQPVGLALVAPPGPITSAEIKAPAVMPGLRLLVLGQGMLTPDGNGATRETFQVRFAVTNVGSQPMTLDPSGAYLMDEAGEKIATGQALSGGQRTDRVTVAPGQSAEFSLAFELSAKTPLKSLDVARVRWPYTYGDQIFLGGAGFRRVTDEPVDNAEAYGSDDSKKSPYISWSGSVGQVDPTGGYGYGWGASGYGRRW
jgi:hypothetical protein